MSPRLLIPLLLALVAAKLAAQHLADADLFWHLRLGLDMLERGELPRTVEYTWALADKAYLPNDWLAELAFAASFRIGGYLGVAILKALLAAGLSIALYFACLVRARGNARAAGLAAFMVLFVGATNFIARPVMLGHLCLALELLLVELAFHGRPRAALFLPAVFALWVNVHGSWPLGIGALAAATAYEWPLLRRLAGDRVLSGADRLPFRLGAALSLCALLLNPVGARMLLRPFQLIGRQADITALKEWSPVPLGDKSSWILFAVAALLFVLLWRSRLKRPLAEAGLAAASLAMALASALYHLGFAVLAAPLLAGLLAERISPHGFEKRGVNLAVAALATVLLGALTLAQWRLIDEEIRREAPVEAVAALERSGVSAAPGFNYFDWGGYLVLRRIPTFVDGRLEPFLHSGLFTAYLDVERRGALEELERRQVKWALTPADTILAARLRAAPGWRAAFEDGRAVLWLREP